MWGPSLSCEGCQFYLFISDFVVACRICATDGVQD